MMTCVLTGRSISIGEFQDHFHDAWLPHITRLNKSGGTRREILTRVELVYRRDKTVSRCLFSHLLRRMADSGYDHSALLSLGLSLLNLAVDIFPATPGKIFAKIPLLQFTFVLCLPVFGD